MEENKDWFKELFIDEAKPALERHSGGGAALEDVVTQLATIVEVI